MKINLIEKELEQAIETIRTQLSLTVNAFTVLVLADITLIGYAINTKSAGIIFVGSIIPIIILIVGYTVKKLMVPIAFTAIYLESRYGDKDGTYLASTFIYFILNQKTISRLKKIADEEDKNKRLQLLKKINTNFHWTPHGIISIVVFIIFIGQISLPLILAYYLGWKFY